MLTLQKLAAITGVAMLLSLSGAAFADKPKAVKHAVKQIRKDHKEYHKDLRRSYNRSYYGNRGWDHHDRDYENESWGVTVNPNGGLGLYYSENKASYPGYGYSYPGYGYTGYGYGSS